MKKLIKILFLCLVVLMLFSGLPYLIPTSEGQSHPSGPFSNSAHIVCNDVHLHYRHYVPENDNGRPWCMMIHGFSGSTWTWRYTADSLCALGYHVVSVDIPPYGYSDRNPLINGSMTARASLLHQFTEQVFPGRRWHLIGHSIGGGIVEALALMYPENIVSVTFVAGALFTETETRWNGFPVWMILAPFERLMIVLGEKIFITPNQVNKLLGSSYGTKPSEQDADAYYSALSVAGTAKAIIRSMTRSKEIAEVSASQMKVPVLAVWGSKDTWVPLHYSKPSLDMMHDVTLVTIDGAAHCPMETHHIEFMKYLAPFLEQFK